MEDVAVNRSAAVDVNLIRLLDLAINPTPSVGIVNFNILKTFLLEILKALDLQNHAALVDLDANNMLEEAIVAQNRAEFVDKSATATAASLATVGKNNSSNSQSNSKLNMGGNKSSHISILTADLQPLSNEKFRALEDKLSKFEQQIAALNSLPTNKQIIEKAKDAKSHASGSTGPILEIWQYTQLSKRMESNEEGITKLTSLLQDLLGELSDLKEQQLRMQSDVDSLKKNYTGLNDANSRHVAKFKELEAAIETLSKNINNSAKFDEAMNALKSEIVNINKKLVSIVNRPDLDLYVTWDSLEKSLKGLREALDSSLNNKQTSDAAAAASVAAIFDQKYTQTTPVPQIREITPDLKEASSSSFKIQSQEVVDQPLQPTPSVPPPPGPPQERPRTAARSSPLNPSKELQDLLLKLGTLNERHEQLRDLVEQLRKKQDDTPPPPPPPSTSLTDDLLLKLNDLQECIRGLEELKNDHQKEVQKRRELESLQSHLNGELQKIRSLIHEYLNSSKLNGDEILKLREAINIIDERKADKNWLQSEMESKAEKKDLDLKLSKKAYDETFGHVTDAVSSCVLKSAALEDDFKKENRNLYKELESKLDKLELSALKEYIEKNIKKLKRLQNERQHVQESAPATHNAEDDAAGLRKQLLRFHCISCDRPIEINNQHQTIPSLPSERGMRPIQTPRPYTTFELDQIRQFQKQQYQQQDYSTDLFSTIRQCGGPHTLTVPHKKLNKAAAAAAAAASVAAITPQPSGQLDEPSVGGEVGLIKSEVHIQGQDGHIYKGRIDAKLSVEMKKNPKKLQQPQPTQHQFGSKSSLSNHNVNVNSSKSFRSISNLSRQVHETTNAHNSNNNNAESANDNTVFIN